MGCSGSTNKFQYTCDQGHNLDLIKKFGEDEPEYSSQAFVCNLCGVQNDQAQLSSKGDWHCKKCNFDVCFSCQERVRKCPKMSCTNNHPLRFTKKIESYGGGTYSCNVCNQGSLEISQGVMHCEPCQYDACPNCVEQQKRKK